MHEEPHRLRPTTPERQNRAERRPGPSSFQPHRKGRVRKVGWEDRKLFMTVSEKAGGVAKSSLARGGVLERGKHRKSNQLSSQVPPCLCVLRRLQAVAKQDSSSWREKDTRGELALAGTPLPLTLQHKCDLQPRVARSSYLEAHNQI